MGKYVIGEVIRHFRKQAGMSQEELALEIMDTKTLGKIERGEVTPYKTNIDAIFERLGVNPNTLTTSFLSSEMAQIQKLTDKLDIALASRKYSEAKEIITALEADAEFAKNQLNAKYILAAKADIAFQSGESPADVLALLNKALAKTRSKFRDEQIAESVLTRTDFLILNMLAIVSRMLGEEERAINILYALKTNIEARSIDKIERGRRLPQVVNNLANCLYLAGRHNEVLEVCHVGRLACTDTGFLGLLPDICICEANSLFESGDKEASRIVLRDVFYTLRLLKRYEMAENIKAYAREKFGADF